MTTKGQTVPDTTSSRQRPAENRPGFRRLGLGGFVLSLAGALTAWSLMLALLGIGALDFTFFGLQVASYPEPFVLNGVALPLPVALVVVAPLAMLGIVGGGRVWLGWASPRLALIACVAWVAFAVVLALVGGNPGLLAFAAVLFAVMLSGAWAARRTGSGLLDLFRFRPGDRVGG